MASQTAAKTSTFNRLQRFAVDSHLPKYILFGIITVKSVMIYDKFKHIVAVNQMQQQIITHQSSTLRKHFNDEAEMQDVLTKRILQSREMSEDETALPDDKDSKAYEAKAKQIRIK